MNEEAARRLAGARATGRPCAPVRDLLAADDLAGAYAIQAGWVAGQVAAGARVVGRKIGLTNPEVQAQLGVDQPDFGTLLDTMDCPAGQPVDIGRVLQPKIEAEIAFILASDLTAAAIGPDQVAAATAWVVPALEIVGSRIAGWDISLVDTVADNASAGLFTLGAARRPAAGLDLAGCAMTMWRGDEVVSAGTGAACLGDPLAAVAWLAATARRYGAPLRAGEVVLSGSLGPVVPVGPGDRFRAEITGLGAVEAAFTGRP
jgi:2-keto-4-pentenoate hydratase